MTSSSFTMMMVMMKTKVKRSSLQMKNNKSKKKNHLKFTTLKSLKVHQRKSYLKELMNQQQNPFKTKPKHRRMVKRSTLKTNNKRN